MQREVELAVPSPRESVACAVAAGHLNRGDAGIVGERRRAGEPARPPGTSQQTTGDNRADAIDRGERAAVLGDRGGQLGGQRLEALVGIADLRDEIATELFASNLDRADRAHSGEQPRGHRSGEIGGRPAGYQVTHHRVQLVHQPGALGDDVVAALVEQCEDSRQVLGHDHAAFAVQRGDAGRRGGIDDVVFTSTAAREFPHPGGRGGRNVVDHFTPCD